MLYLHDTYTSRRVFSGLGMQPDFRFEQNDMDAPSFIPCGSMERIDGKDGPFTSMTRVNREWLDLFA